MAPGYECTAPRKGAYTRDPFRANLVSRVDGIDGQAGLTPYLADDKPPPDLRSVGGFDPPGRIPIQNPTTCPVDHSYGLVKITPA
jgi:hypothetical protein